MTRLLPSLPAAAARQGRAQHALARTQHVLERTLLGPAAVAAVAGGALLGLQVVDPTEPGHLPTCPFLAVTGLYCPGCGSLRMLHELGDGDVVMAAAYNPLGLLMVAALLAYWTAWTRRVVTGRDRGAPMPGWLVWSFLAVVVGYAVLRNLPGMALLAPG